MPAPAPGRSRHPDADHCPRDRGHRRGRRCPGLPLRSALRDLPSPLPPPLLSTSAGCTGPALPSTARRDRLPRPQPRRWWRWRWRWRFRGPTALRPVRPHLLLSAHLYFPASSSGMGCRGRASSASGRWLPSPLRRRRQRRPPPPPAACGGGGGGSGGRSPHPPPVAAADLYDSGGCGGGGMGGSGRRRRLPAPPRSGRRGLPSSCPYAAGTVRASPPSGRSLPLPRQRWWQRPPTPLFAALAPPPPSRAAPVGPSSSLPANAIMAGVQEWWRVRSRLL